MPELKFPDELLKTEEAAAFVRFAPGTLRNWRASGKGPPFLRGRPVLYQLSDLVAWNESRRTNRSRIPNESHATSLRVTQGHGTNVAGAAPAPDNSL